MPPCGTGTPYLWSASKRCVRLEDRLVWLHDGGLVSCRPRRSYATKRKQLRSDGRSQVDRECDRDGWCGCFVRVVALVRD